MCDLQNLVPMMGALISPLPIFSVAMDSMSVVHLYFFTSMESSKKKEMNFSRLSSGRCGREKFSNDP